MKSYQHEVGREEARYANLAGYEIASLSETGDLHLKNSAGNRHYTTVGKLEQEAAELGDDKKQFHEGKFTQRQSILGQARQLSQRFWTN